MNSLPIPGFARATQSHLDRQSHQPNPSFRGEPWLDHSYDPLGAIAENSVYPKPSHNPNRALYSPGPISDPHTDFHYNRTPSSYPHPAQSNADTMCDAGSRYQSKRFAPYLAGNAIINTVSDDPYHSDVEGLPYTQGCHDATRATLGEQSWDLSSYCIPAICNDPGYYQPDLFPSATAHESLSPHMHNPHSSTFPHVHSYTGDTFLHTSQAPLLITQAYNGDRLLPDNEILPSVATVTSQQHSSNSTNDSLVRTLEAISPHGQSFPHYISAPARSKTTHSSIPANPSYAERQEPSAAPSLGWTSHLYNTHRSPDPPESSNTNQRSNIAPPSASSQLQIHPEWGTPSAGRQPPEMLVLPSSPSSPTSAAVGSSQSILKLNHHVKKSGGSEKKQTLACLFCRERKIACGRPAEGSADSTCNQCARRQFKCEYPKESRRGQHKRNRRKAHDVNDAY